MRSTTLPWVLLCLALLGQGLLLVAHLRCPPGAVFVGDESYYVGKASQLVTSGRFEPLTPIEARNESLDAPMPRDVRPPGYPVLVAAVSGGRLEVCGLRWRVASMQFLGAAATAALLLLLTIPFTSHSLRPAVAILIGFVPWNFEYVASIYPDVMTMAMTLGGISLLYWYARRRSPAALLGGSLMLSSCLLLRPEMIAIAPIVILAALLMTGLTYRSVLIALSGLLIAVALQFAYRVHLTGDALPRLFPRFSSSTIGVGYWIMTWVGTEHETLDGVAFRIATGQIPNIPARAVANEGEREELNRAFNLLKTSGNSPAVELIFERLARQRVREDPIRNWLLPKLAAPLLLWVNTNTNSQLLGRLVAVPRTPRRAFLGLVFVLRLLLLAAFASSLVHDTRFPDPADGRWQLRVICAVAVVWRTVFIGMILSRVEHRYMLPMWPPMLLCALLELVRHAELRWLNGRRREVAAPTPQPQVPGVP